MKWPHEAAQWLRCCLLILLALPPFPLLPSSLPRMAVGTPVTVQEGMIIFGDDYRQAPDTPRRYEIVSPRTSFSAGMPLAFVAQLREPAQASTLDVLLANKQVIGKGPPPIITASVLPSDPEATMVAGRLEADKLATLLHDRPRGTFVLTITRTGSSTPLARGDFYWQASEAQRRRERRQGMVLVGILIVWALFLPVASLVREVVKRRRDRTRYW
jgi:hypothetical protein